MARFRCQSCLGRPGEGGSSGAVDVQAAGRALRQASVGQKTRSAGREPISRRRTRDMDMTFTGGGLQATDTIRRMAEDKLSPLARIEPRAASLEVEVINEHHPRPDGLKRVEA